MDVTVEGAVTAWVVVGFVVATARGEEGPGFFFMLIFWPLFVKDTFKDLL